MPIASTGRGSKGSTERARRPTRSTAARGTRAPKAARERAAVEASERLTIRLFDADRQDHHLTWDEAIDSKLSGRQLLWFDVTGPLSELEAERLAARYGLDERTRQALTRPADEPHLALHGTFFHMRLIAEPDDREPERAPWLDIIAGPNVVITAHAEPLGFVAVMDDRIERDTTAGLLQSTQFVASLLDSTITTYFHAIDSIEDEADELDAVALRDEGRRELLEDLVEIRQRVARLRRMLTAHRDVFASLADADFTEVAGDHESAPAFQAVAARFEGTLASVDSARESILGSFDIYMTRTAQRTNDVMKVLALATVLLLPGSLIAGLLGMNVTVPLDKDAPSSFWMVLIGVGLLAVTILLVARRRGWL